jgi:Ulp1 protease family, C-terminal catalytic domain
MAEYPHFTTRPNDLRQLEDRQDLLTIPPLMRAFVPSESLPVAHFLQFPSLPSIDHSLSLPSQPFAFFSIDYASETLPDAFTECSLPPTAVSSRLLEIIPQAVDAGYQSIVDPRCSSLRLPIWVISYWHKLARASTGQKSWDAAHSWLSQRSGGNSAQAVIARDALQTFESLGWDVPLHGFAAGMQSLHLAEFLASNVVKGRFVDAMIASISERVNCVPDLRKSVLIEDLTFSETLRLEPTRWANYDTDRSFSRLRAIGDKLYSKAATRIVFPVNISGVHWAAFSVDTSSRKIQYGDSLDWNLPASDIDLIQRWLRKHGFEPFQKACLPHGIQDDEYSCAIAMINTIRHHLFGDTLFNDAKKDELRIQEYLHMVESNIKNAKVCVDNHGHISSHHNSSTPKTITQRLLTAHRTQTLISTLKACIRQPKKLLFPP